MEKIPSTRLVGRVFMLGAPGDNSNHPDVEIVLRIPREQIDSIRVVGGTLGRDVGITFHEPDEPPGFPFGRADRIGGDE